MPKPMDLTGQKYGRLTALEEAERQGYIRRWKCQCDCGNITVVYQSELRSGKTKSCGCLNRELSAARKTANLKGKRFGKLRVLERQGQKNRKYQWLCQCDCGNKVIVTGIYLTNGDVKSCGCRRIETGKELHKHTQDKYTVDDVNTTLLKSKMRSDNTTGHKGVIYNKKTGKYVASITIKRKRIYLGQYSNIEDAIQARQAGEEKYHKPYMEALNNETNNDN